jgi:hypothetical protein
LLSTTSLPPSLVTISIRRSPVANEPILGKTITDAAVVHHYKSGPSGRLRPKECMLAPCFKERNSWVLCAYLAVALKNDGPGEIPSVTSRSAISIP